MKLLLRKIRRKKIVKPTDAFHMGVNRGIEEVIEIIKNMQRKEFLTNLEQTFKDGLELVKLKNADYAEEGDPFLNFKNSEVVGVSLEKGILVRIMDKITRISHLLERPNQVKDEKLADSILDAINYLAILKVYEKKEKNRMRSV